MHDVRFRDNNFDLIRLLAASQVVLVHSYKHFKVTGADEVMRMLAWLPGVPVFFVISGFLISASWERSESVGAYARNRLLRIYPGLWGCFAVSLCTVFLFYEPLFGSWQFAVWLAAQVTFGQFYNPDALRGYGVGVLNGSLWTIPVELQFYALLPVLYWLLRQASWHRAVVSGFMVFLIIVNMAASRFPEGSMAAKLAMVTVWPHLFMFFAGVLLQRNFWFVQRFLAGRAAPLAVGYLSFAFVLTATGGGMNQLAALFLAILTISFGYTGQRWLSNVLRGKDLSYGVYIYHMVWVNALLVVAPYGPWGNVVATVVLTFLSAAASWQLIERPALSMKSYSVRQPAGTPALEHPPDVGTS